MRKMSAFFILFAILSVTSLSGWTEPSLAQPNETLTPRFGTGVAVIQRPDTNDFYFSAHFSDDGQSVIGYSTQHPTTIYSWDISPLADDIIIPDAHIIDLTAFIPKDFNGETNVAFFSDTLVILQYEENLLQIDLPSQTLLQTMTLNDILPDDSGPFTSLATQNETIALLYDDADSVVVWNTAANTISAHPFDEDVSDITAFRDGWHVVRYSFEGPIIHFFCDFTFDTCFREEIWGDLALDYAGVMTFADTNPYSRGDTIPTTYYTFDFAEGLTPTESHFPNLPSTVLPISISPDEGFILTLTYDANALIGTLPTRRYDVWAVDGTEPLYSIGHTYQPYWFGDHFIALSPTAEIATLATATSDTLFDSFSIYEMRGKNGLPYDGLADYLYSHPEISHLRQISADGRRYLHVTGGAAIVLPIEYQAIDDLLTVEETIFSAERGSIDPRRIHLSPDGQTIVGLNMSTGELIRWEVETGQTASLDLRPDLTEESLVDVALRDADMFLQIDNRVMHLDLSDLSILDEIAVNSNLTDFPNWAVVVRDQPRVVVNGDNIAVLFDDATVLWQAGEFKTVDMGGMRLYPYNDGWLIYRFDYTAEPDLHELTRCDLSMNNCTPAATFEGPLAAFDDDVIVGGNSLLGFTAFGIPPTYWTFGESSIRPIEPILTLPDDNYVPASFYGDYAIVAAPAYDYDPSGRHYEVWSVSESRRLTRLIFRGDWEWFGDYVLFTQEHHLSILHLSDGRFRRWAADADIAKIQGAADGTRLLVVTADGIQALSLSE